MHRLIVPILIFLVPSTGCEPGRSVPQSPLADQSFCEIMNSPTRYHTPTKVTTTGIAIGYHGIIIYNRDCPESRKVAELALTYEQRAQVLERVRAANVTYSSPVFNNNAYAEIRFRGTVKKNDAAADRATGYWARDIELQFDVEEILEIRVLEDEILPPAVGLR